MQRGPFKRSTIVKAWWRSGGGQNPGDLRGSGLESFIRFVHVSCARDVPDRKRAVVLFRIVQILGFRKRVAQMITCNRVQSGSVPKQIQPETPKSESSLLTMVLVTFPRKPIIVAGGSVLNGLAATVRRQGRIDFILASELRSVGARLYRCRLEDHNHFQALLKLGTIVSKLRHLITRRDMN